MTKKDMIFSRSFIGKSLLVVVCALSVLAAPAFGAASDNGCDFDKVKNQNNDFINPNLVLCSTHAYNIGKITNPDNAGERQEMNEVVALKATIMTQQMKKQYDYLETTIKRLKTQMEKAILVSQMEASGAASSDSSSGGSSTNRANSDVVLSNADNCRSKGSTIDMWKCLQTNLQAVRMAINGGNNGDAKRQLDKDIAVATLLLGTNAEKTIPATCKNYTSARQSLTSCVDNFSITIMNQIEEKSAAAAKLQAGIK